MGLFISQGILVKSSTTENGKFLYNPSIVVLLTEFLKLFISCVFCFKEFTIDELKIEIKNNTKVFFCYIIPSMLYCLYNNLIFINLQTYDPTTYFLLLQFRVVVTGIVFQFLFEKRLTNLQWKSLFLLTTGCIVKQIDFTNYKVLASDSFIDKLFNQSIIFIFIQVFSSCFAGVYNEYLIKTVDPNKRDQPLSIWIHNFFFCLQSIICNCIVLFTARVNFLNIQSYVTNEFFEFSLTNILNYKVIMIILNNTAAGIVTSIFLKSMNSIMKTFASSLEIIFTAIFSLILLGVPISNLTVCSIVLIIISIWLYAKNPIKNAVPKKKKQNVIV